MNEPRVFIHIGYGRTATSFLQKEFFPNLDNVQYLGKYYDNYPEWLMNWNYIDDFLFDKHVKSIKGTIFQNDNNKLISSEAFTQTGGIYQQIERIKKVIPAAKVILVLRKPTDLVVSKYRYLVEHKLTQSSLSDLLDFTDRPYDLLRRKRFYLQDYIYINVINKLVNDFGEENILLLKYENLNENYTRFLNKICDFTESKINKELKSSVINSSDKNINIDAESILKLEKYFSSKFDYELL